jgi:hypothetical protein
MRSDKFHLPLPASFTNIPESLFYLSEPIAKPAYLTHPGESEASCSQSRGLEYLENTGYRLSTV